MLISERLKKFQKNAHTKIYKETNMMNMSKSGKVHFSITFLSITFRAFIFAIFSTVLKSA